MGLYLESGYANMHDIMTRDDTFNIEIVPRGTGKTYGALLEILESGKKFIYLRRTQTEADLVSSEVVNPFKKVIEDHPHYEISTDSVNRNMGAFVSDGKEIGYSAALSTFASIRGMDFSDIDIIFFDEFIPEKRARPIKEEFQALMNMYETVNRNRELQGKQPVKLVCCANSNDIANPIFIGLEIVNRIARMMDKGTEVYRDPSRALAVYMLMHSPISEKKAQTALYRLTKNNDFSQMALENIFQVDTSSVSSRRLTEYRPVARIGEMVVYKHKSRAEFYVNCSRSGSVRDVFTTSDVDRKRFVSKYSYLYFRYLADDIIFEDVSSLVLFEKYFL